MSKKCSRCNEEKPFSLFQKRLASIDGLTSSCKLCLSEYDKKRSRAPHRVKARLEYSKTEKGKESGNKAKKKYINKNPVIRAAHVIAGNAMRDGKIVKLPCEVCNSENSVAHHDDYYYPLTVRFLCPLHHKEWHQENGEGLNAK